MDRQAESEGESASATPPTGVLQGHCLELLRTLPAECVQTVVTSPPYWSLRDYGTEPQFWDADPACQHIWGLAPRTPWANEAPGPHGRAKNSQASRARTKITGPFCEQCGAWRGELGQEPSLSLYTHHLVTVFAEVWRVLKPDGTLWLNLGDCYAGQAAGNQGQTGERVSRTFTASVPAKQGAGLKNKDLVGLPWRVAFALQEWGWWLRTDIVWHKENPLPESVTDRPTRAHEFVFLLTKRERYYYNQDAIREPYAASSRARIAQPTLDTQQGGYKVEAYQANLPGRRSRDRRPADVLRAMRDHEAAGRNRRDVWSLPLQPYNGAHFAVMPEALAEPCVLAGSRPCDLVLDPFGGAGTVGVIARRHSRQYLLLELSAAYTALAEERIARERQPHLWTA